MNRGDELTWTMLSAIRKIFVPRPDRSQISYILPYETFKVQHNTCLDGVQIFIRVTNRDWFYFFLKSLNLLTKNKLHCWNDIMMTSSNGNIFRVNGPLPVTGRFPLQRPGSFYVSFDLRLNKRLSKQSRRRWFETSSLSPLRQCIVEERYFGNPA